MYRRRSRGSPRRRKPGCRRRTSRRPSHIDTDDLGETYSKRSPFVLRAIETMVAKLGSNASDLSLYALGGSGWFDAKAFKETVGTRFAKVLVEDRLRLNNKKILYDPNGSPPVKMGAYTLTPEARSTNYENTESYEDRAVLFEVRFGTTETYQESLSQDPEDSEAH